MSHIPGLATFALTLLACASPRVASAHGAPARSGPYTLELIDGSGRTLPTYRHAGRTYVLGRHGQRYLLRVRNETGERIEVVASVDGRDVVDGRPASTQKPGYLVEPWGQVVIDGFRLSTATVAAFRFSAVEASYAARMGDARDVGVVGVAVFREAPRPVAWPYPYAAPERGGDAEAAEEGAARAQPPASGAASAGRRADADRLAAEQRPGLGTGFGEEHGSPVVEVSFERAGATPAAVITARYDDRQGLAALGIDVDGWRSASRDRRLRDAAQPFRSDGFAEPPPGWSGR